MKIALLPKCRSQAEKAFWGQSPSSISSAIGIDGGRLIIISPASGRIHRHRRQNPLSSLDSDLFKVLRNCYIGRSNSSNCLASLWFVKCTTSPHLREGERIAGSWRIIG